MPDRGTTLRLVATVFTPELPLAQWIVLPLGLLLMPLALGAALRRLRLRGQKRPAKSMLFPWLSLTISSAFPFASPPPSILCSLAICVCPSLFTRWRCLKSAWMLVLWHQAFEECDLNQNGKLSFSEVCVWRLCVCACVLFCSFLNYG